MKAQSHVVKNERLLGSRQGLALGMVMVVLLAVSLLGAALISAASINSLETARYLHSVKAFWLAEAGVQRFEKRAFEENRSGFSDSALGGGTIQVTVYSNAVPLYAESVGTVQGVEQKIRVKFQFLAYLYKKALYAANNSGTPWTFTLRGNGAPNASDVGGRDIVMGDVFAAGDVKLYEQSIISNAPSPNTYNLRGDVEATGTIGLSNSASITGTPTPNAPTNTPPNFIAMNYASNNSWNVAREFQLAGVSSGSLPANHPLRNVVKKNPSDRADENSSTVGDDFYFEPYSPSQPGGTSPKDARTPLNLGRDKVYYVDGHVWFNHHSVYGFAVTGTATIAATRDIHISDNLKYAAGNSSLLGLVALGSYNSSGQLQSGGNVYFGDPEYGTMYTADAFMLAANNFYYNTSGNTGLQQEPETGFQVFGNFAAMNQVLVYRDWYNRTTSVTNGKKITVITTTNAAWFDTTVNRWKDLLTTNLLTSAQTNTLRHYQMIVKYDERIRKQATQPPRLPGMQSGSDGIYGGVYDWNLYPY